MKVIFVIIGAVVGLMLVRAFMLDTLEQIGWRIFWDAVFNGHFGTGWVGRVVESSTFTKSVIGMAAGGLVGFIVSSKLGFKK